jgi:hypothetical protein
MADFAAWVTACERALGWEAGTFLRDYRANVAEASDIALEASPLTAPLQQFIGREKAWEGSASALLAELKNLAGEDLAKTPDWPKKPHVLSGKLRRLAPDLRKAGIDIAFDRQPGGRRSKVIRLADKGCAEASQASRASHDAENAGQDGTTPGRSGDAPGWFRDASGDSGGLERDAWDARDASTEELSGFALTAEGESREVFEV